MDRKRRTMDFEDWEDIEYIAVEEIIQSEEDVQVLCTPTPNSPELFGLLVNYYERESFEGGLSWNPQEK
jgi:hypothetical protein